MFTVSVADTDETLGQRITIDGYTWTGSDLAVAGATYFIFLAGRDEIDNVAGAPCLIGKFVALEAKSVKIEVRKTTANGSGTITASISYEKDDPSKSASHPPLFGVQPDAKLSQDAPVQNTWYTLLDTTLNAQLVALEMKVAGIGETLEVQVTIDGQVLTKSAACNADTLYYVWKSRNAADLTISTTPGNFGGQYATFDAQSVKIEVRKTTANGAGTITARAQHMVA